jgi:hypothetical protein
VDVGPALERIADFAEFPAGADEGGADEARWERLLTADVVGRPVGAEGRVRDPERSNGSAVCFADAAC